MRLSKDRKLSDALREESLVLRLTHREVERVKTRFGRSVLLLGRRDGTGLFIRTYSRRERYLIQPVMREVSGRPIENF
ncbi:MAG: hypothetical protein UT63_C0056G0002 [Candidatus Gottesmanbacteria bacterium GW2011_GWC2_39_8]|uniref:Uncharacterized protein n=1 Tax=Candidatus Gottesmanbacteria bacterium GW2011_GWC2_39_8 TaxID=1618450 RepID=A0A0G0PVI1_9BACT|nr:MAG: hypothetical protein UT63_C0056G0002 [Candidatus Gottesmanbacteria bacterium GW2011_GWC2_39_8]